MRDTGLSLSTVLLLTFVVGKLLGIITWSWIWVLSPLWIPCLVSVVIATIICAIALVTG